VEGLRVELAGEGLDLVDVYAVLSAGEALADGEVFEVEALGRVRG
jgi:hypothetical protein